MKIGVVGASGYAGGELLRLLLNHPEFKISYISAGTNAGELITAVHPGLTPLTGRVFSATEPDELNQCDLVFLALPHGESAKLIVELSPSVKVVDLGADFRLTHEHAWKKYYGGSHAGKWTYGLPELSQNRFEISRSSRVANPGCYATAISLAAAPALHEQLIDASDVVVVAASGTTGAGRSAKVNLLGSEVMNSMTSYKFGGVHQHTPEIEEALAAVNGQDVKISFTPILAPMPRGILATITARLVKPLTTEEAHQVYEDYFASSAFVHVLPTGQLPQTAAVLGTNNAHLQVAVDDHTNRLLISIAIDNLGKGAAGQAIQNANLMVGLAEDTGLNHLGVR